MISSNRLDSFQFATYMFQVYVLTTIVALVSVLICNEVIGFSLKVGMYVFYGYWSIISLPFRLYVIVKRAHDFNSNGLGAAVLMSTPFIFFVLNLIFYHWLGVVTLKQNIFQSLFYITAFFLIPITLVFFGMFPSDKGLNQYDEKEEIVGDNETEQLEEETAYYYFENEDRDKDKYIINEDGTITFKDRD